MSNKLYTTRDMNKRYYVTPQAEVIHLSAESAILAASPDGFHGRIDTTPGHEELSNRKNIWGSSLWENNPEKND